MKNSIKILSLLFVALFTFVSCSKDDDPADNDIFVGKYEGSVSYNDDGEIKSSDEGSVTVVKLSGDTYNFNFSDDIPSLNGIKMKKGDNNTIFIEDNSLGTLSISASRLTMAITKDGKIWTADCER